MKNVDVSVRPKTATRESLRSREARERLEAKEDEEMQAAVRSSSALSLHSAASRNSRSRPSTGGASGGAHREKGSAVFLAKGERNRLAKTAAHDVVIPYPLNESAILRKMPTVSIDGQLSREQREKVTQVGNAVGGGALSSYDDPADLGKLAGAGRGKGVPFERSLSREGRARLDPRENHAVNPDPIFPINYASTSQVTKAAVFSFDVIPGRERSPLSREAGRHWNEPIKELKVEQAEQITRARPKSAYLQPRKAGVSSLAKRAQKAKRQHRIPGNGTPSELEYHINEAVLRPHSAVPDFQKMTSRDSRSSTPANPPLMDVMYEVNDSLAHPRATSADFARSSIRPELQRKPDYEDASYTPNYDAIEAKNPVVNIESFLSRDQREKLHKPAVLTDFAYNVRDAATRGRSRSPDFQKSLSRNAPVISKEAQYRPSDLMYNINDSQIYPNSPTILIAAKPFQRFHSETA